MTFFKIGLVTYYKPLTVSTDFAFFQIDILFVCFCVQLYFCLLCLYVLGWAFLPVLNYVAGISSYLALI